MNQLLPSLDELDHHAEIQPEFARWRTGYGPFEHALETSLAGCYRVVAIDLFDNESRQNVQVCVESCLQYELPNAFTPSNDGMNDLFTPRPGYRFVSRVDFYAFNRWGNEVFQTEDPLINWDGIDSKSGKALPEDVYYYTCKVYEQTLGGTAQLQKELSGYIHLIRD